jgi:hypothetical protein
MTEPSERMQPCERQRAGWDGVWERSPQCK